MDCVPCPAQTSCHLSPVWLNAPLLVEHGSMWRWCLLDPSWEGVKLQRNVSQWTLPDQSQSQFISTWHIVSMCWMFRPKNQFFLFSSDFGVWRTLLNIGWQGFESPSLARLGWVVKSAKPYASEMWHCKSKCFICFHADSATTLPEGWRNPFLFLSAYCLNLYAVEWSSEGHGPFNLSGENNHHVKPIRFKRCVPTVGRTPLSTLPW